MNIARADLSAIENRPATPDARLGIENLQSLLATLVAAVKNKPVRVDDCRRPDVLLVCPGDRAGRGAACAENALGGVFEARPLLWDWRRSSCSLASSAIRYGLIDLYESKNASMSTTMSLITRKPINGSIVIFLP